MRKSGSNIIEQSRELGFSTGENAHQTTLKSSNFKSTRFFTQCAAGTLPTAPRSTLLIPITNVHNQPTDSHQQQMSIDQANFCNRTTYIKISKDGSFKLFCMRTKNNQNSNNYTITNIVPRLILSILIILLHTNQAFVHNVYAQAFDPINASVSETSSTQSHSESNPQSTTTNAACFGGLQTFEKISMSSFENPLTSGSSGSFGSGILVQQDDQALTSECVNLCRSQSNCLSFVIDYNKFECKSYATTQQELQQEFGAKFQSARTINNASMVNGTDGNGYQESASNIHLQQLLPSSSSNYFEKICLDGVANRNQFSDVCGQGRLWTIERVVDSFMDGFVEKEVTNVNNKDECSKLCIFEAQFVCRSADYDQHSRLCRLSKEDRRTQPQAMRFLPGSNRQYLENQCATPGPSSCIYETKKNLGIISMDALKFAQTAQDCQMKCNQEATFNCRSYSFHEQRCFLSGDDSVSLNSNLIKLPMKQGWLFGEKKCLIELCTKGIFSYEKITGYTLRSALSTPIDLMMSSGSSLGMTVVGNNLDDLERLQSEKSQTKLRHLLPMYHNGYKSNSTSSVVSTMMLIAANNNEDQIDPMHESASSKQTRSTNNLAITEHCRHSCDLGYLNCPAFTIDYKNNRCQRLDRNSQGRHHELVARDGFAYYEKICLRVPEIMSMCQDKYWIFERIIGYELAPRLYDKSLKFVQSRRDCEEYCLEEKQFQCRSALYNDETSDCKLSRYDRRLALQEGGYYRNFNVRISYLENQCVRDHKIDRKCYYEQARDEPSYPTYTERIEMAHLMPTTSSTETESNRLNTTVPQRFGPSYCEQLCNDNAKFECHSFGYYASTAQCFLSGDDSSSAGELAATPSTGFTYYEKKCRLGNLSMPARTNFTNLDEDTSRGNVPTGLTTTPSNPQNLNPFLQPPHYTPSTTPMTDISSTTDTPGPFISNNNISIHIDQQLNMGQPVKPKIPTMSNDSGVDPEIYKCGFGHTFVYQRISGFEPIGGYLTLLVKNNEQPGIVDECSMLCKRAFECRAFVVDYGSNQCFAMLENSSVGLLSLRQTLGKDYFEGFCVANHLLLTGSNCRNKTWIMDKIVDQAVVGVQHQKLIADSDRIQCRQACIEERLFWCKSAMFDSTTGDCKLYSIDRESIPQMRLLFTKGVDFFENQCQIVTSSCPYDAIERDMTIITITKSIQARSTFDCEVACNNEISFNCRSYTYLDQYPSLPNMCLLSSDSRSTGQRGSVKEHPRTLYAERNCYYRRPRYPGGASNQKIDSSYAQPAPINPPMGQIDPYRMPILPRPTYDQSIPEKQNPPRLSEEEELTNPNDNVPPLGQGCEPHQYTFERTFGYDFKHAPKERAPIAPTIGIAISCQQECLRRGDRCQSFVVDYALPYQSCFLIETQVGANKKLLVKSPNSAYFEKVCLPRTGIDLESLTHASMMANLPVDAQSLDISPSYSHEPWSPQIPNQLPYYLQQQQLVQNYPSRSCAKLWYFERFINHNFTVPSDRTIENSLTKAHCETQCLNEANFSCRAATYDYTNKICRLFKSTRRTIMSQLVDLESSAPMSSYQPVSSGLTNSHPGTAHVIATEIDSIHTAAASLSNSVVDTSKRQSGARQISASSQTAEPTNPVKNIDYLENTCTPEPSSCQYRQLYDQFSLFIDKVNHAVSLSDCQRQCDQERLFSCKSINYDSTTRNCMLVNEDLISLNRGQQASLLPKKNTIYSEKGNCEMISVQCNSQEMLVSLNFDSPFRGRIMAKGNPEQCFLVGDGQTSIQFPIVFGPKCNSRQEGHNTFVNEVIIQQHPVIMTESDKTVRVMCAFEAPEQTITLKNPSSHDNKTGIDVGTPEASRTRHDKQHFNSVVSNKAAPPSVILRILDQNSRDASMINLGDDLTLKIQMQTDGQNSALGIFARNLVARSSNGESLLLIDNEGCPVDHQVFPALEVDPKDGKSLISTFKAFRFPSSGLVNFEVQIRFCPERCQPVDCHKGHKMRSYGRKKRDVYGDNLKTIGRTSIIQSVNNYQEPISSLDAKSTVMTGKAFEYVRKLMLAPQTLSSNEQNTNATVTANKLEENVTVANLTNVDTPESFTHNDGMSRDSNASNEEFTSNIDPSRPESSSNQQMSDTPHVGQDGSVKLEQNLMIDQSGTNGQENQDSSVVNTNQKSILMHVDEKVFPSTSYANPRVLSQPHVLAPYGRFPVPEIDLNKRRPAPAQKEPTFFGDQSSSSNNMSDNKTISPNTEPDETQDGNQSELDAKNQQEYTTNSPSNIESDDSDSQAISSNSPTSSLESNNQQPNQVSAKDVPLKFSILVGENQTPTNGWAPVNQNPVLVMNSTNVDLDHIVIPGKKGQFEDGESNSQVSTNFIPTTHASPSTYNESSYREHLVNRRGRPSETNKRNASYEQTFDALPSSSVSSEVSIGSSRNQLDLVGSMTNRQIQNGPMSETAASHDCQVESGKNRLRAIIWTGTLVIALNVCLVVLSLILYFRKVRLRQNHTIVRSSSSDCTQMSGDGRWPRVLLKSKNKLGTSLNTHEHFFCKLNSGSGRPTGLEQDFNWPNLSSSSSHSTISSLASPLPSSSIRINQMRPSLKTSPFDCNSSLRSGNFNTGHNHKTILDVNSCEVEHSDKFNARYTNSIDEIHSDRF